MTSQSEHNGQQTPKPSASVLADAPITVVGIGADAGGLAALQRFFAHLAGHTGMAFVIVLRGSGGGKPSLARRLQSLTPLPVQFLTGDTPLEPDHIYIAPLQQPLTLSNNLFQLGEALPPHERHTPIDAFLQSLVRARGADAIGLLLSGKGSDGIEGLKALQAQGGLTLVQAPQEARYPALPRQAIDLALANGVGTASELAQRLNARELMFNPAKTATAEEETAFAERNDEVLNAILTQLYIQIGYDLSYYKRSTILRRIARRLQMHSLTTLAAYADFLQQHPEEVQALFKDCLISVTNFFRDPEEFNRIEKEIIPKLVASKTADDSIRVWAPGCATGEEAYSLAMLFLERLVPLAKAPRLQIFATDIDEAAIATARRGLYPKSIAKDVSPARLQRFFTEESDGYQIKIELRETVLFAVHNLLKDPPFAKLDLISCRNLLIYFNRDVQSKALDLFHYALNRNGYLFLGTAESIDTADELFALLDKHHHIFQQRTGVTPQRSSTPSLFASLGAKALGSASRPTRPPAASIEELYQQWTLRRYAPPRVLVNENYEVTHLFNGADRYLREREGAVTQNILQKVLPELRLDLRTALYQALNKGERTDSRLLRVLVNRESCLIQLHIGPIQEPGFPRGYFEVVFEERQEPAMVGLPPGASMTEADNALTSRLEEELLRTRERLQMIVEEHETSNQDLKIANEELQSINEELKSTTEELETSKEELQSMNEELSTINHELKLKIDELSRANSDLLNLIVSTDVGTLFLDLGMRIKRFTPRATELFNLIESDVGRPLSHISHKIRPDVHPVRLLELAARVLSTLEQSEELIQSETERWYIMRMFPYRTVENTVDGVVITFVEITALKRAEHETKQRIQQQTVADLGRQALQGDDPATLVTAAMERATAVLDMEFAKVLEMQADGDTLLYKAGLGWSAVATTETTRLTSENSQSWYTFHEDHPIVVENSQEEKRFQLSPLLRAHNVTSGITVAIPGRVMLYGVFGVYSQKPRTFTSYEVDFLQALANLLGEAIERKRTEMELAQERARFEAVLQYMPAGVIIAEAPSGKLLLGNKQVDRIWRHPYLPVGAIDEYREYKGFHADGRPYEPSEWPLARAVTTGEIIHNEEIEFLGGDGVRGIMTVSAAPIRDVTGRIATSVAIFDDITARKQAEAALREGEERLRLAVEATELGIWEMNPDSGEIRWSAQCKALHGLPLDTEITRELVQATIYPADLAQLQDALNTFYAPPRRGELRTEHRIVHPDGAVRWIRVQGRFVNVMGNEQLPTRSIGTMLDITEQKHSELNDQFLSQLSAQLSYLADPDAIRSTALEAVGGYLDALRCAFHELNYATEQVIVHNEWRQPGVKSTAGTYPLAALGTPGMRELLQNGHSFTVCDTQTDPLTAAIAAGYEHVGVRAFISVSYLREGKCIALLAISSATPRVWRADEVALLETVAARVWPLIEKARIEQQLREREAILSTLGDNLPSGAIYQLVQETNGHAYYNYISNSIEALLGLPAATILLDAGSLQATYQAEDLAERQQRIESSRAQLTRYELEALRRLPNGESRWIYERGQPRPLPNGATAWDGIYLDITARKAAQAILERYQLLAQQTRDMIFFVRPDGAIIEANQGAVAMYGYAYPTLLTKSMRDLRAPAFLESLETDLAQANTTGILFETLHQRADGSTFPVEISARGANIGGERLILSVVRDITERKQVEEQLRYHAHLLEQIEDAVIATDTELRVTAWNRGAEKLYGWQAHEVLGQALSKVIQSNLTDGQRAQLLQEVNASNRYTLEITHHHHKQGKPLQLEANTVALRDPNGQVTGYLSINRDISERKRAEAALRQSEARYRELANAMPQIVYTTRPDGRADFTNQQWHVYTGISVDNSLEYEWTHSIHPADRAQAFTRWQASVQTGTPYEAEYRLQGKAGEYRWFLSRAVPIRDETGQLTKWIGNSVDIHERKQAEVVLQQQAQMLESTHDAIFMWALDNGIAYWNRGAELLYGYTKTEALDQVSHTLLQTVHPMPTPAFEAILRNEGEWTGELQHTTKTGQKIIVLSRQQLIQSAEGKEYVLETSHDITDRKQAEETLRASAANLRAAIEHASDAIFIATDDRIYVEVNAAACELAGYSREELIGKHVEDLTPPVAYQRLDEDRRLLLAGRSQVSEWGLLRKDGVIVPIEVNAKQLPDGRWQAIVRDITERKQFEARERFLADLGETMVHIQEPDELLKAVVEALGAFLAVSRCYFVEIAEAAINIRVDYHADGSAIAGIYPFAKLSPDNVAAYQAGHTLVSSDLLSDPETAAAYGERYEHLGLRARVGVPLLRDGRWSAALVVSQHEPRTWSEAEVHLIQIVAERTWLAVENRRLFQETQLLLAQVEAMLDNAPTGMAFYDREKRYVRINQTLATINHLPVDMHIGQRLQDLRPEQAELLEPYIDQVFTTNRGIYNVEIAAEAMAGERQFLINWYPVKIDGETRFVGSIVLDITERKQAEETIRQQLNEIEAIYAATPVGLCMVDANLRYVRINEALAKLNGYPVEWFIGRTLRETGTAASASLVEPLYRHVLATGEPILNREIHGATAAEPARERDWLVSYYPLKNDQNQVTGVNAVVVEITERKQNERELQRLNDTLEQRVEERTAELEQRTQELLYRNRELDQFAYVASHDLRSPLRAIDHLSTWIVQDAGDSLPPASRDHLSKLRGRVKRLERLLDDLLAYSRADRYQYPVEPVDTKALVEDIIRMVAPPEGFNVTMPDVMPVLQTERVPLELVLRNLINNAIKHHDRQDGQILVTAQEAGDFIEFTITDDGPGIAAEFHERIFQMFQTLKPRDSVEGSGMGLAIVKKVVESRGGKIAVASNAGQGATFRFTWLKT